MIKMNDSSGGDFHVNEAQITHITTGSDGWAVVHLVGGTFLNARHAAHVVIDKIRREDANRWRSQARVYKQNRWPF